MPGIRGISVSLALIAMGVALASCSRSPCCDIKVIDYKDRSPADKAIDHETRVIGITSKEIKTCFGNGIKNDFGVTIYPLINEKDGKKRYCHVTFDDNPKTGRKYISATSFNNYSDTACKMRAIKCLRPKAYSRIKEEYNIDEN
jgi:hypothetical protein